jgi:hypothetical protein
MTGNCGDSDRTFDRRQFLEWASAVGLASVAPGTIAEIADAKTQRSDSPRPYATNGAAGPDPSDEVFFAHVTEHAGYKRRIERFEEQGDPTELFHPHLREFLAEDAGQETLNVAVNTLGERNTVTSRGGYQRKLHGYRPTRDEVERLEQFGDVVHIPEVISTKVSMRNVSRDALESIASLDFVVGVNKDPDDVTPDGASADDLLTSDYYWYSSTQSCYSVSTAVTIGILDDGYEGSGASTYTESYAETIGIDTSLANDFTEDGDWSNVTYTDDGNLVYHGDDVADSAACMLKDGDTHDDLFVPLKVASDEQSYWASNTREAIEYATTNGIDVINLSYGGGTQSTCPSTYCEELDSYTDAGYYPFASAGNDYEESSVTFPGGEWLTIGVGGFDADCSGDDDYKRDAASNYGEIYYDDPTTSDTYCTWCSAEASDISQHSPHVYGCYETYTDGGTLYGTSFASPQAPAAGVLFRAEGYLDYQECQSRFRNMDYYTICDDESTDSAELGQLLNAYDVVDC